jgi:hypothetical protein
MQIPDRQSFCYWVLLSQIVQGIGNQAWKERNWIGFSMAVLPCMGSDVTFIIIIF